MIIKTEVFDKIAYCTLHSGFIFKIDEYNLFLVKEAKYEWNILKGKYTNYVASRDEFNGRIRLHRLILNEFNSKVIIDHKDRDGLNNLEENLRKSTHSNNLGNAVSRVGFSKYKGVSWNKNNQKWKGDIQKDKIKYFLGYFDDEIEAASAYDIKATELFGEFAYINLPERLIK